jgi:hypothetical protein
MYTTSIRKIDRILCHKNVHYDQVLVAHTYNPNYLGG